jgi:aspartate-semialdehyde dehydrogenase
MRIAVVGASGLVGRTIIKVLEERKTPVTEFIPVASRSSYGKNIEFLGKEYSICSIEDAIRRKPDIVIFSAGKDISLKYAEKFAELDCYVIDNSSAWRMNPDKKLVVPEVNITVLDEDDRIIANPNCSTIQLLLVLWPLHKKYKLKRILISTYQSVTGSGAKGTNQLMCEREGIQAEAPAYPHQIDLNCIPHAGNFMENNYTDEEMKLLNESRKIMAIKDLKVSATAVRVPVLGGHSESVNIEFFNKPDVNEVKAILDKAPGVKVLDNPSANVYPMPVLSMDKDETFVGRIREDLSCENAINLWITADNLRKGAATNAVQIAEYVYNHFIKNGKA